MLDAGEGTEHLRDGLGLHAAGKREQRGEHGVFEVMPAGDTDVLCGQNGRFCAVTAVDDHTVAHEHAVFRHGLAGEIQRFRRRAVRHGAHNGIVIVQHGEIVRCLVIEHLALCGNVILHRPEVIEVVGRDVAAGCGMGMEASTALELQGGRLRDDHVARTGLFSMLGDGDADVAENKGTETRGLEQLARERGTGGFPVCTRDADKVGLRVAVPQLDLGFDLDAAALRFDEEGGGHGDDGTRDDEIHAVQKRQGVLSEPILDCGAAQRFRKAGDLRFHIVDADMVTVSCEQFGSADAAFCHADDERGFVLFHGVDSSGKCLLPFF